MEIILPQFKIDDAIDTQWKSVQSRNENIQRDRHGAEEIALNALTKQFESELNGCLDNALRSSLSIKILPPKEISALSVVAVFTYLDTQILLKRDEQNWELAFNGRKIACTPDMLQKTILLELGKIKNKSNETS
ncbi:MAG: hypothetical protein KME23_17640 [Goleter apudmare HA4340-LM2]|jgi:hypothetical protein|nr:hypothetical protein [Goleter apudmare HA4340-LM2]MBW4644784.1 hypothetical protein [Goleter apudmare HA4340-LM2]